MTVRRLVAAGLVAAATASVAAQGGTTITDVRKNCQITLPAGWTATGSTGYSADKAISATVNGAVARGSFADAKTMVQGAMKPTKVLQDTAQRFAYAFDPGALAPGKTGRYVVAATTPTCAVSLMFPASTADAVLTPVIDSLAAVKK